MLGVALVATSVWCVGTAAAAPPCAGGDIYIAAHQDDTLLFQSPDLLEDVRGNRCVQTVFTTAGDAGKGSSYWEGREAGAEEAYAEMAGVPNVWQGSTVELAGHKIHKETLVGRSGITILYLRLPDGGADGDGFPMYGYQSLAKLWNGGNGKCPRSAKSKPTINRRTTAAAELIDAARPRRSKSFGRAPDPDPELRPDNWTRPLRPPEYGPLRQSRRRKAPEQLRWLASRRLRGLRNRN